MFFFSPVSLWSFTAPDIGGGSAQQAGQMVLIGIG